MKKQNEKEREREKGIVCVCVREDVLYVGACVTMSKVNVMAQTSGSKAEIHLQSILFSHMRFCECV